MQKRSLCGYQHTSFHVYISVSLILWSVHAVVYYAYFWYYVSQAALHAIHTTLL